jgi:hypothetical protein
MRENRPLGIASRAVVYLQFNVGAPAAGGEGRHAPTS